MRTERQDFVASTPESRPVPAAAGGVLLAVAVVLTALNLRPAVTSVATLRERSSGTLERLLSTPLGRFDFLGGYAVAFGVMAVLQALIASAFAIWVCGLDIAGPLLRSPLEPWRPWFETAGLDWPEPQTGAQFNDIGLMLEAIVSNQGVGLVRQRMARQWLAAGQMVKLLDIESVSPHGYYIVEREQAPLMPEARYFIDWLLGLDW